MSTSSSFAPCSSSTLPPPPAHLPPPPPSPPQSFPLFPTLPPELQLKILSFATHIVPGPRIIDIWTDWKKCMHANTIFYIQHYTSLISSSASVAPPLLSVSRAARRECLAVYRREFESSMTVEMGCEPVKGEGEGEGESSDAGPHPDADTDTNLSGENAARCGSSTSSTSGSENSTQTKTSTIPSASALTSQTTGITVTLPPTIFLAPSIDILVPRGFWNIVSFSDFCSRIEALGVQRIAIDVGGCFWRENLKDYCRRRCWVLNGVREVWLYEGAESVGLRKGAEYLERVRERNVEKRELRFVDLEFEEGVDGEVDSEGVGKVKDVERFLVKVFDVIESEEDVEGDEDFGDVRKAQFVSMEQTEKSVFKRPAVRIVRLVTE